MIFDVKLDKQEKGIVDKGDDESFKFSDLLKLITNRSFLLIALLCVTFYSAVFPFMQYAPDLLINKFGFTYDLPESASIILFGSATLGNASVFIGLFIFALAVTLIPAKFNTKQGKRVSLAIILVLFATFIYALSDTFAVWFVNGPKTASLIPLGSILFTPIFGKIVDTKGRAASLMILGAVLLIFAHLTLSIFDNVILGYLGLLSLGIAFSLVPAAMWPSVAKIVAENRLGTAYAVMFTIQNWGLNAFFKGIGWVLDLSNPKVVAEIESVRQGLEAQGMTSLQVSEKLQEMQFVTHEIPAFNYTNPILMLVGLGVLAMFLAFMLKRSDVKQGYGLELPSGAEAPRDK
jgi:MFS family permease